MILAVPWGGHHFTVAGLIDKQLNQSREQSHLVSCQMARHRGIGYVAHVTLSDLNIRAAQRADVEQAAYFRSELEAQRQLLLADIGKRQPLIERPADAGTGRVSLSGSEVRLRHIDWLIARLDNRFDRAVDGRA
jgi:hypothetical protein